METYRVTPPRQDPGDPPFLAGPRSRTSEFFFVLRVVREFFRGFRTLHFVGPSVTVFTDSVDEAVAHISEHALDRRYKQPPVSPWRILGERTGTVSDS